MVDVLKSFSVELVVMAGFMRLLTPLFLNAFSMKIMNIHPAILPSFPGVHAQKRAADYGVRFSGCTVHFADEGVDSGPIIIQAIVPAYDDDTEDTLAARILKEEHRIYPQAIQFYAEGRIEVIGRRVRIKGSERIPERPLHNPPLTAF
jgi:phosphoribosylglycinamide formyltransferase-1